MSLDNYFLGAAPAEKIITVKIGGADYAESGRLRMMLQDTLLDWGAFLQNYKNSVTDNILIEQVSNIINIDNIDSIKKLLECVKLIHKMPAKNHLNCMIKQYFAYENLSLAIHGIFTTLVEYIESMIKMLWLSGNNKNWSNLHEELESINRDQDLASSSIILLFCNPPKNLGSPLEFPNKTKQTANFIKAIKKFKYMGFCPKVPIKRLNALLQFPLVALFQAIKSIHKDFMPIDLVELNTRVVNILNKIPKKNIKYPKLKKKKPPKTLNSIQLIKWYIDEILNMRKQLLDIGNIKEKQYGKLASVLSDINDLLIESFSTS